MNNTSGTVIIAKSVVTIFIWASYLGAVMYALEQIQLWAIALACIFMLPVIFSGMVMWSPSVFASSDNEDSDKSGIEISMDIGNEKRKRERLDEVLRNLSTEQLETLRDGLSSGAIDDERLRYMLDDDGELIERNDYR